MSKRMQNAYAPDYVSPPGETLEELLAAKNMTQTDLAQRMGRPLKTINEIIQGKAAITPETALQLERVLGAPASFWNNRERNYRESLARHQENQQLEDQLGWLQEVPVRELVKRGWVPRATSKIEQVRLLLQFFCVASTAQWHIIYDQPLAAFRRSEAFPIDSGAVAAWLRRGEILAQELLCAPYEATQLRAVLTDIRTLTSAPWEEALPELTRRCATAGVAVVFLAELPRTRVCGATRWLSPHKALIQLSSRYKTDDHLWFTFFHEVGHILLHGKREMFLEGWMEDAIKEAEANRFAADALIPSSVWARFVRTRDYRSKAVITAFAQELGIAPGIVVGRLQHEELLLHSHCNDLKRQLLWHVETGVADSPTKAPGTY